MTDTLRLYKSTQISTLVPYENNARTHSDEQIEQIVASIKEFGFTNPVLITEDGRIIAGHGRVLAMQALGEVFVPTITVGDLTPAQVRALILADNKLAENAGWDAALLTAELKALELEGFDLGLIGFSEQELHDLLHVEPAGGGDPDAAPPLPAVPTSVEGDVWVLGPHRVVCGDCCRAETYEALLGVERVDACWTDPPYNVNYESAAGKIKNDQQEDGAFRQFLVDAFALAYGSMKPGAACYVAHADTERINFTGAFTGVGFKLSGVIIWKKDALVLGRSDYQWIHEPILYGWRPGSKHRWFGGRKNTTVVDLGVGSPFEQMEDGRWMVNVGGRLLVVTGEASVQELVPSIVEEPRPRRSTEHPTMKPVALIERMLGHSARAGDLVLDPFGGSGSTLIAADRLGMSARLIELDPGYCDVIVRRWQGYAGRKAVHVNGKEFGE